MVEKILKVDLTWPQLNILREISKSNGINSTQLMEKISNKAIFKFIQEYKKEKKSS